jgi:hypothetical protein
MIYCLTSGGRGAVMVAMNPPQVTPAAFWFTGTLCRRDPA